MTTFSLGGLSRRLRSIGGAESGSERRFRGRKAAIEALRKKRQVIDSAMMRLLEDVSGTQARWSRIKVARSTMEEEGLTLIVARAQIMHRTLMLSFADIEALSIFGLNACDTDMQAAHSLLAKLRLAVLASNARAGEACQDARSFMPSHRRLTA